MNKHRIIVVDDDTLVLSSVELALHSLGYEVVACESGAAYLDTIDHRAADLILMDVHLQDANGIELLETTRAHGNTTPVMIITGYGDVPMAVRAMKLGAEDFLLKPVSLDQLELAVDNVLRRAQLRREVEVLRAQVSDIAGDRRILGNSAPLRRALTLASKYAESDDTTVLLTGESGTGKELFAKYIHENSPRKNEPLIVVDCGALPKELAENELFGYERGAFTGATEKLKKGRFELAQRGTIFLDEIGELPLEVQVKLLRVLESRRYYRLGGTRELEADVRVIAATNRDLGLAAKNGTFRQDLFYRLNVAAITLPPLRERPEDIPVIAAAYVDEFNRHFRKHVQSIAPDALALLERYTWPGNVRELRNVMERAMLVDAEDIVKSTHVAHLLSTSPNGAAGPATYHLSIPRDGISMDTVMRDLIVQTLKITDGNQIKAAKILGITRAKFRYRMQQLGIESSAG